MSKTLTSVLAFGLLALLASSARAGVARHDREEVKEIKKGGEVVGLKIKMTLHPEGYERARVGLGPVGVFTGNDHRPAASDPAQGHLLHQFQEVTFDGNQPKEVEFKVLYKDVPKLKPGTQVELISAFNKSSNQSYWHVFGMKGPTQAQVKTYTLPGKGQEAQSAPKRKMLMSEIRRVSKSNKAKRPQLRYGRRRSGARKRVRTQARKPVRARR